MPIPTSTAVRVRVDANNVQIARKCEPWSLRSCFSKIRVREGFIFILFLTKSKRTNMTVTKEEPEIAVNGGLPVVTAVGIEEKADEKVSSAAGGGNQGPPIPAGHARFYCNSEF